MLKIERVVTPSPQQWERIIMGARNPMNSWNKSDSEYTFESNGGKYIIGEKDRELLTRLAKAGSVEGKFRRMINVYVDITAPLYWWKEFDTYKIGTVANSCSTMHKIADKEFTMADFSCEHLFPSSFKCLGFTLNILNETRDLYLGYGGFKHEYGDHDKKDYWWQMIQLLPSSYNQKRTVMINYEVLAGIYCSRRNHKLDEWRLFCRWIETLPYNEFIINYDPNGCEKCVL